MWKGTKTMKNRCYLDVHVLQTVPPSCVNRDDTGSPKTAIYGGTTRARVSSQAWKHAMREMFRDELIDPDMLGARTKNALSLVEKEILKLNHDAKKAKELAKKMLDEYGGVDTNDDDQTQALFFIGMKQAKELAEIAVSEGMTDNEKEKACEEALQKHLSVDVALFGRMVAIKKSNKKREKKQKELNCDASAQVAHSISTHTVQNEYDYFTAVDDLAPEDNTGAGHIGTVEFNSSTLYRYATVNLVELSNALGKQVAAETAAKFVEAFVRSMPTGKQNTFANRTLPSMVYVTIRRDQPVNLCGAFEKPVSAKNGGYSEEAEEKFVEYANPVSAKNGGYSEESEVEFVKYAKKVYDKYASAPDRAFAVGEAVGNLEKCKCMSLDRLLESVAECVKEYLGESEGM